MTDTTKPAPGSDAAVTAGCRCPVLDNNRGRGAQGASGPEVVFWMHAGCPLHGESAPAVKRAVTPDGWVDLDNAD